MLPANMIVAPNSPRARAQVITTPEASAVPANGTVIDHATWRSPAPSTRAASSKSRSTPRNPARAARMKNGIETNIWARIDGDRRERDRDPEGRQLVAEDAAPPEGEQQREPGDRRRQDDRQVDDASTKLAPRNRRRARRWATGVAIAIVRTRLTAVVMRDSWSASRTAGSPIATWSAPPAAARTTRTATGRPRNRPTRPPRRSVKEAQPGAGGRKPNEARIVWPSGPATQSRNACASPACGEAFTTAPA